MPDKSIERVLGNLFSESTRSHWKKIAMQETQGKDPFEALSWHGKDEITFLPYYDKQDVANLNFLNGFQTPASKNTFSGQKRWMNLPAVNIADITRANSLALEHLSSGADGIFFDIDQSQLANFHDLLQDIQWPHCFIAFHAREQAFSSHLSDFIREKFNPASVTGALFWESIPKKNNFDFYFNHCLKLRSLGLMIPPSSPAVEISHALIEGVKVWERFSSSFDEGQVLRSISFSICADASILETVAKLKALRMLWIQVAHAYGMNDYEAADLHIHARSVSALEGAYAPHENMLKGTFAAMSAVMGGCDSLTIMAPQEPVIIPRWARNVSSILAEESFFSSASDPVAGSYAVDTMADQIAKKAWEIFQIKIKAT